RGLMDRIDRLAFSWQKYFDIQGKGISVTTKDIHEYSGLLIAAAYPERIAKQSNRGSSAYKLSNGRLMKLENSDPLVHFEWLAVASADLGKNEGKIFLAAPLDANDLKSIQKEYDAVKWDEERESVVSSKESRVGGLVLK